MICISCKKEHNVNFCPSCGEKSDIKKITFMSIIENAISTITNMDKGFLYNLKSLTINPKEISIEYIQGKRRGILNPISFLILSVTLYLFIENFLKIPEIKTQRELPEFYIGKVAYAVGRYVHVYFKYFWIFSIFPLAFSTKLIFRKYNLIEHLAINSFILGQATIVGIICFTIMKLDMVVNPFVYLSILWLIYKIFINRKDKFEILLMSFAVLLLFIIQLILISIGIGLIMA